MLISTLQQSESAIHIHISPPFWISVPFRSQQSTEWASQVALMVKNLPANARNVRDAGSTPGSGRSPGEGHGNPLQYSCLENLMGRGAWQATRVQRVRQTEANEHAHNIIYHHHNQGTKYVHHSVVSLSQQPGLSSVAHSDSHPP